MMRPNLYRRLLSLDRQSDHDYPVMLVTMGTGSRNERTTLTENHYNDY